MPLLSSLSFPRYRSRTLSSRTPFPLSFSPRSPSVRPSVRPSFRRSSARSLASSLVARPRTPLRGRRGTNNARFIKRVSARGTTYVCTRCPPLPADAVPRDDPVFHSSDKRRRHARKIRPREQPHAPRGAHTQRPNAFCNGDLWRETAEGPHGAPWITPPPGVRNVTTRLGHGRSFLHRRRRHFSFSRRTFLLPCVNGTQRARSRLHHVVDSHSREVAPREVLAATFTRHACPEPCPARDYVGDDPRLFALAASSSAGRSTPARR